MISTQPQDNSYLLYSSIFLRALIHFRLKIALEHAEPPIPAAFQKDLENDSLLAAFISLYHLNDEEIAVLLLALVPHILPNFIGSIIQ